MRCRSSKLLAERGPGLVGDVGRLVEFVDAASAPCGRSRPRPRRRCDAGDVVVGEPGLPAHHRRAGPTRMSHAVRCATRRMASSRSRGGRVEREQQVDVEAQERLGQRRDGGRRWQACCRRSPGCAAPREHHRAAPAGRRRRPTGRRAAGADARGLRVISLAHENQILIFRLIDFHAFADGQRRGRSDAGTTDGVRLRTRTGAAGLRGPS